MTTTSETSVLANLNDLFEMEADRRAEEAAAKERAKAAAAARREADRRAREEAIEAARAEERRRAERERLRREAGVEDRIAALRAELAEVRAAREEVRLQVAAMAARSQATPSRRGTWMVGGMAAVSLIAALGATAATWPSRPEEEAPARVDAVTGPGWEAAPDEIAAREPTSGNTGTPDTRAREAASDSEREVHPAPIAVVEAPSEPRARPGARPRPRPRPRVESRDDLSRQLDLGDDDGVLSDDFLRHVDR